MSTDTPITDKLRAAVESAWKGGGFQGFSEEEWLEQIENIERQLASVTEERDSLKRALEEAVDLIHSWHNMGIKDGSPCDVWPIYRDNAPEMKRLFAALSASAAKEGGKI